MHEWRDKMSIKLDIPGRLISEVCGTEQLFHQSEISLWSYSQGIMFDISHTAFPLMATEDGPY